MKFLTIRFTVLLLSCNLIACAKPAQHADTVVVTDNITEQEEVIDVADLMLVPRQKSTMELRMEEIGLVDVKELDPTIVVELIYATPDNFTGEILYDSLQIAYLLPHVAEMLVKAQKELKELHPDFSLVVYDAARPVSVQRKMWNLVKGTPQNIYVSNPNKTGLHNYGAAVDLTILDETGKALDMGTPYDSFKSEAHIDKEEALIKAGKLTREQVNNRKLLRRLMQNAGFKPLRSEWWHFNACTRDYARQTYKVIDF